MSQGSSIDLATIQQQLKNLLSQYINIPATEISTTTLVSRYGLNSISAVSLSGDLESFYGIVLDPSILLEHNTIEKLATHILTVLN